MAVDNMEDFKALERFFRVIEGGLKTGRRRPFLGSSAGDVVFEFIISVPDYPRRVVGRESLIELYREYQHAFFLDRCFDLQVHRAADSTVTLEYASEGKVVATWTAVRQPLRRHGDDQGRQDRPLAGLSRPLRALAALEGA
jgi:uncharacterized protein